MDLIDSILVGLALIGLVLTLRWSIITFSATKGSKISLYKRPRQALLVVDIQEDFTGELARLSPHIMNTEDFIATVNRVIRAAAERGMPVAYIGHEWPDNLFFRLISRGLAIAGQPGAKQDARLVRASEYYFVKNQADAFANSQLEQWLRENQVNEIFLVGLDAVACAFKTALGAVNRNYRTTIIIDAVATASKKSREDLIKLYRHNGIEVLQSLEFIDKQ